MCHTRGKTIRVSQMDTFAATATAPNRLAHPARAQERNTGSTHREELPSASLRILTSSSSQLHDHTDLTVVSSFQDQNQTCCKDRANPQQELTVAEKPGPRASPFSVVHFSLPDCLASKIFTFVNRSVHF